MDSETQDLVPKPPNTSSESTPPTSKLDDELENEPPNHHPLHIIFEPAQWIRMLCRELSSSFVFGVVVVYGLSQGFGSGSFFRVVSDFYWKDVQKAQPSTVQLLMGFYYIPWIMRPVGGILTDAISVCGYHRRPYFILAGILGLTSIFFVTTFSGLPIVLALICLVGIITGFAIADVTIDACIARYSIEKPNLAADMQSLNGVCSSTGALIGFLTSGVFVDKLGAQAAMTILAIPASLVICLGFVIHEHKLENQSAKQKVLDKVNETIQGMSRTIQVPAVWKPSLYMYLSIALSFSTHEGHFYWYTDPTAGPGFSQEFIGVIYAIGAAASMVGVLIYHKFLRNYQFRSLLFYAQILYGVSGILDLIFVLRWNLKVHMPDSLFVILEECFSRIISRIRWMPMVILSTRLCPIGIEGTFFALLMCIDSSGGLTSKTIGGLVLHLFHVTRNDFTNLWLVVLIRNVLRFATLGLIFLVPKSDQNEVLVPPDLLKSSGNDEESIELTKLNQEI